MVPRATARSPRRVAVVVPLLLIGLLLGASPAAARTPVGPQLDKTAPVTSPPATPAPPQRQLPAPSTPPAPAPSYDVSYPQCDDALPDAFPKPRALLQMILGGGGERVGAEHALLLEVVIDRLTAGSGSRSPGRVCEVQRMKGKRTGR